jgi:flagellar M-ring protein FliF
MDQIKKLLSSLTAGQVFSIVLCALAVGGGILWFSRFERESGMRPLYTSLSPEDASAMVQKLREGAVDYRVSENGTTLLVPEQRVPELRLEMAGLGLPKTGRIGFEIFDKTNFGITDFAEHVNYRRAVEGELERSIMAIAEVQQARVHVTLPKDSVFTDAREPAKASVLVGLRAGSRLSQQNVVAITNLVSSAVEGLSPESISVVDMHGNLLSRPRRDQLADGVQNTVAALDYRQAIEHDLAVKINNTLEPLLGGSDKFRTGVSAEVDMTSGEQSEETFDPTRSVMVTSQKTEETSGTTRMASGVPGTAANLPQQQTSPPPATATPTTQPAQTQQAQTQPPAQQQTAQQQAAQRPAGNTNSTVRRTENIAYQSSRTTKHVKLPQGTVKRLSIAVLVDQGSKWEGQGKDLHRVVTPPEPEKLKAIQALVSTLVGLDTQRGDQLTVEALPFDNSLSAEPMSARPPESPKKPDEVLSLETLKKKPALLWGSVGGAVLLAALAIFAMTRAGKRRVTFETREVLPVPPPAGALTATVAGPGAMNAADGRQLPALMPSRTEVLLTQLQESGKNNPEVWAGILRGWLTEEESN